jgi:HEAT repeat protein
MIATPEAIEALVQSLHGGAADAARHAALIGLTQAGRPAVEPLAAQLASPDPVLRSNAAQALGWLKPVEATDALVAALGDPDVTVRSEAAWALGELGTTDAREALAAALERETNAEAQAAVDAALVQAQRASGVSAIEVGSGGALLRMLAQVPPTRWTLFGLGVVLAVALLFVPSMHVRQGSA